MSAEYVRYLRRRAESAAGHRNPTLSGARRPLVDPADLADLGGRVRQLVGELALTKKVVHQLTRTADTATRYGIVAALDDGSQLSALCRLLEVTEAGYLKWKARTSSTGSD